MPTYIIINEFIKVYTQMKEEYYFQHDCDARQDEKIINLRIKQGWQGYGLFWAIIERLRVSEDYMCIRNYNILAFDFQVNADIIKNIVEDFGLFTFTKDGKRFYSERLIKDIRAKEELSAARGRAGKKGMENRWGKSNNKTPIKQQDGNTIEEPLHSDNNVITNHNNVITNKNFVITKNNNVITQLSQNKDKTPSEVPTVPFLKTTKQSDNFLISPVKDKITPQNLTLNSPILASGKTGEEEEREENEDKEKREKTEEKEKPIKEREVRKEFPKEKEDKEDKEECSLKESAEGTKEIRNSATTIAVACPCPYEKIIFLWNSICQSFPKVEKLTEQRKGKIRCRFVELGSDLKAVEELFKRVQASPFLRGDSSRGWRANFDWLFSNGQNWVKVTEGNYDYRPTTQRNGQKDSFLNVNDDWK